MFVWSRFFNPCLQIALNCWSVAVPNIKQNLKQWPHLTGNNSAAVNIPDISKLMIELRDGWDWSLPIKPELLQSNDTLRRSSKSFEVYDFGLPLVVVSWIWKLLLEVLNIQRTFWWSNQQARLWKDSWLSKQKVTNPRQLEYFLLLAVHDFLPTWGSVLGYLLPWEHWNNCKLYHWISWTKYQVSSQVTSM